MAENYAGYVSNRGNVVDWNQAAQGLSGAVQSVDDARTARRAENEKVLKDSEKLINDTEQPKSQTLNEFVLKGADQGRSKLMEWNRQLKAGEINGRDYKSRVANLNEYWGSLANTTKTLDARLTQAMQRQQVGADGTLPPGSAIEAEMQMYFGGLSQLSDKGVVIDDDGRVMVGKFDKEGNMLSTEDVKYINNPANIEFNRTDLSGMVNADVKNWGDWAINRTTDARQNPQFAKSKSRLVNAIVGTPRSAASVLVDNTDGEYMVYFNEEDKQQKIQQLKEEYEQSGEKKTDAEIASQLILMQQDANGDYQPNLTNGQLDAAKKLVESEIEIQVGRKVDPRPVSSGGNNGPSYDQARSYQQEIDENLQGYIAVREAWNKNQYDLLSKGGYSFVPKGNGVIEVYQGEDKRGNKIKVDVVDSPGGLAKYAFNGDPNTNLRKYDEGRNHFYSTGMDKDSRYSVPGSGATPSEAEFNKKWASLKKGQTTIGPDGKTYTKR